jgi:hypothetical protein
VVKDIGRPPVTSTSCGLSTRKSGPGGCAFPMPAIMARETRGWSVPYPARPVNHLHRGQLTQADTGMSATDGPRAATRPARTHRGVSRSHSPIRAAGSAAASAGASGARERVCGPGPIPAVPAASRASPPTGTGTRWAARYPAPARYGCTRPFVSQICVACPRLSCAHPGRPPKQTALSAITLLAAPVGQ